MKLKLLLILFLFAVVSKADTGFNSGLRFGLDASQVNGDALAGFNKAGIIGGLFVNRQFSRRFSTQMEIVYIQKGSRKPVDDNNFYYRLRVHYIEVPLMFRYHTLKKFIFEAGPSFGSLIFSQENNVFGVLTAPPFKKIELSYNAGIIYNLSETWAFDARYSNSITTIRPYIAGYTTFFDKGQYNLLLEFTLMFNF